MAVVGAALPFIFYGFWFTRLGPSIEERCQGLLLVLCPPYLGTMAFDHMSARDRIESIAIFAAINAFLYSVVGLLIGVAREFMARSRRGLVKR
jgi:hypothetical protein